MHIPRKLIEEVEAQKRNTKAFDYAPRRKILKILKAYAMSPNFMNTLAKVYEDTIIRIITPNEET